MAVFTRPDSPWFWMLLEGTGRKKEKIGIRRDASDPDIRKDNRAAAEAIYHARMVQLANQRAGLPVNTKRTFTEQADWYEQHIIPTHKSQQGELSLLKGLRKEFGTMRLSDIRTARVREFEAKLLTAKKPNKTETIYRKVSVLRAVLSSASGEYIDVSPLESHTQKRTKYLPKRTITATEEPGLLKALKRLDPELHDIYVVGVGTLLRQENLVTLARSQYHQDQLLVDTKTGPHVVHLEGPTTLQTRARTILKARWPASARAPFFPQWAEVFASSEPAAANSALLRVFRKAVTSVDIPWGLQKQGVVWHTATRATGATRLLQDFAIDIRTVQRMGPWASLDQMADYLGVNFGNGAGTKTRK